MDREIIPLSPLVFGPGTWWVLHLTAFGVDTPKKIYGFLDLLHYIAANLPCHLCRHHATEYLHQIDVSEYDDMYYHGKYVGMIRLVCDFHNVVNERNGKEIIGWKEVYRAYHHDHQRWENEQENGIPELYNSEGKMIKSRTHTVIKKDHVRTRYQRYQKTTNEARKTKTQPVIRRVSKKKTTGSRKIYTIKNQDKRSFTKIKDDEKQNFSKISPQSTRKQTIPGSAQRKKIDRPMRNVRVTRRREKL